MRYELGVPIEVKLHHVTSFWGMYHTIINSDEGRVAKKVFEAQEIDGQENCWYAEVKMEAGLLGIEVAKMKVLDVKKSEWKEHVKKKIKEEAEKIEKQKIISIKKLRFLSRRRGIDTYLQKLTNKNARMALKIRLNMVQMIDANFGRRTLCVLCNEPDSTEHIFSCTRWKSLEM